MVRSWGLTRFLKGPGRNIVGRNLTGDAKDSQRPHSVNGSKFEVQRTLVLRQVNRGTSLSDHSS